MYPTYGGTVTTRQRLPESAAAPRPDGAVDAPVGDERATVADTAAVRDAGRQAVARWDGLLKRLSE